MRSFHLLVPVLLLAACAAQSADETDASEADVAEADDVLGDDRVADAIRGHFDKIPKTYAEAEKLFGVGRACARTDTKEIFVVEESQTREGGKKAATGNLLPRTVVTGCNTPEHALGQTSDPQSGSFGLFIALFSPEAPANLHDPILVEHVEVMALDRKTGLYNFYVFEDGGMQRVRLMPNNDVRTWTLAPGKQRSTNAKTPDRACNNCHVNMGPLMNEMHEPWTNWLSTRKELPAESSLTGETESIVKSPSFANDLQKIMESGIRVWNEGFPTVAGSGFVQQNLDGHQPRGAQGLLKSVFCQTELQYDSGFDTAPMQLFVDPGAAAGGGLQPPPSNPQAIFPRLLPVRSEMDKRIEAALVKKQQLTATTVFVVRLFDEENDIFSKTRCGLLDKIKEPGDAAVRTVLRSKLDLIPAGPRHDYAAALLTDGVDASKARAAYLADLAPRYASASAKLTTKSGLEELDARVQARQHAAEDMFPGSGSPLPLLPPQR